MHLKIFGGCTTILPLVPPELLSLCLWIQQQKGITMHLGPVLVVSGFLVPHWFLVQGITLLADCCTWRLSPRPLMSPAHCLIKGDNLSTTFWERKGSTSSDKPPAYLLRLFGIHQRFHRYVPRFDYISGASNHIADALSRDFHLTWPELIDSISPHLPQNVGYQLWTPSPPILSAVTSAAQETVQAGVTAGNASQAITAWTQWTDFTTELGLDPFLQALQDKVPVLQVFALRVRVGELAAKGHPIRARSAEAYVRHVAQTFLHMGAEDPRLTSIGKIDFRLQRMVAAWKKKDSPPCRVKPVPIRIIRHIAYLARHSTSSNSLLVAVADMIIIAFFFLLRPGEYTDSNQESTPFRFSDVQLFIGQQRLNLLHDPPALILQARFASLTFTDQKNGVRGEVIGLGCSGDPYLCPVKAIIRRVLYLRLHSAPPDVPLARLFNSNSHITASVITSTLRDAVTLLGPELGFLPSDISARCLCASGAMAFLLGQVDTDIIWLIGRWRSDEMLRYLHVQAAPLMQDYARKMLMAGNYSLIPNQLVPMQ
eukprot:CCRYP_005414-RA/>CCRYP_005414-RA protein AED:0.57 eAED:0.10 QI:0/0/0/1/0/0/2/0/539